MSERQPFDLLAAARIVRPAHLARADRHLGLELADQTGILDPVVTGPLVAALATHLPPRLAGLAVGSGVSDVLLGYLTGLELGLPLASITKVDGKVEVGGRLPASGRVAMIAVVLEEASMIAEFEAACGLAGCEAAGLVALVDRLSHADPRVSPLLRWSDFEFEAACCPVCGET